ncbi:hypothetical protein EDD15DRAFT_1530715 [Pisolithus albus]|nr:hypothetical protein EDD15DRAFT_1530715 [Pisolithus albus]
MSNVKTGSCGIRWYGIHNPETSSWSFLFVPEDECRPSLQSISPAAGTGLATDEQRFRLPILLLPCCRTLTAIPPCATQCFRRPRWHTRNRRCTRSNMATTPVLAGAITGRCLTSDHSSPSPQHTRPSYPPPTRTASPPLLQTFGYSAVGNNPSLDRGLSVWMASSFLAITARCRSTADAVLRALMAGNLDWSYLNLVSNC